MPNFDYKTAIDSSRQVFDPDRGQRTLRTPPPVSFSAPSAQRHMMDVYRGQGQQGAVNLGRATTEAQNQYYMSAQRAQDQSVLAGLQNMAERQANAYQRQAEQDRIRYKFLDDILGNGGVLGGLL